MTRKNAGTPTKAARDNRARQLNPNNPAYESSRGLSQTGKHAVQATRDNRGPQSSPNSGVSTPSRGSGKAKNG